MAAAAGACMRMDKYKDDNVDPCLPERYFERFPDSDLQKWCLETVPENRVAFENCSSTRTTVETTVEIRGLNYDMSEEQFIQRFGRFKGRSCKWGHCGIIGI